MCMYLFIGMTHHSVYREITGKWMFTSQNIVGFDRFLYICIHRYPGILPSDSQIPRKKTHKQYDNIHLMEYIGYVICTV